MAEMGKIDLLRKLSGIPSEDFSQDDRLSFAIDYAENAVKNYCRTDEIPKGLKGVVLMIAGDILAKGDFSGLKSLKEGDVKFEFKGRAFEERSILRDYVNQLEIYRKPGW